MNEQLKQLSCFQDEQKGKVFCLSNVVIKASVTDSRGKAFCLGCGVVKSFRRGN